MKAHLFLTSLILFVFTVLNGQVITQDQKDFMLNHAVAVDVDSSYQNGKWDTLLSFVKDKQFVLLGEFNHGNREVFLARNDFIKTLHKQQGVDLILFESGIGEVGAVNLSLEKREGAARTAGFFGGWRTSEFEDLLRFAKKQGIAIGGFDSQRTGSSFSRYFAKYYDPGQLFSQLEKQFGTLKRELAKSRTSYDSVQEQTTSLIRQYQSVLAGLPDSNQLAIRTLENRMAYLQYMLEFARTKNWNARWAARDSVMAENVHWLVKHHQPKRKVVIVAHNFHIARYNQKEQVMGERLAKSMGDDMYVLGVFAKAGTYHDNWGRVKQMAEPDSTALDIKHLIDVQRVPLTLLDVPAKPSAGSAWLFDEIIVNDTFIDLSSSNKMILARCFDGLLLFDKVSPPDK